MPRVIVSDSISAARCSRIETPTQATSTASARPTMSRLSLRRFWSSVNIDIERARLLPVGLAVDGDEREEESGVEPGLHRAVQVLAGHGVRDAEREKPLARNEHALDLREIPG